MSTELLQAVFVDGALSSFIIPIHSQTAYFAALSFGGERETFQAATLAGALGGTVGHMANYLIGRVLVLLADRQKLQVKEDHYDKIAPYYRRLGWVMLLFSWATLFSFFSFAAGIFKLKLRYTLPLLFIGQLGYYAYYYVNLVP